MYMISLKLKIAVTKRLVSIIIMDIIDIIYLKRICSYPHIFVYFVKNTQGYDLGSLLRYAFIGGGVLSPMLYGWYRVLDKRMPGTAIGTSIKKAVIDVVVCGIPYYSVFYCGKF